MSYIYKSNFATPFSSYKLLAQHICRGGWLKMLQAPMSLLILYFFHITNTRGPNKIHTFVLHLVRERTSVCMFAVHQHQRDPINYNSGFQKNWPVSKDRGRLSRARPTQIAAISYVLGKKYYCLGRRARQRRPVHFHFPRSGASIARLEVRWGVSSLCLCVRAFDPAAHGLAHWAEKIKSGSLV